MNTLCKKQKEISDKIAIAFMSHMFDTEVTDMNYEEEMQDFYWIGQDPTGVCEMHDLYWNLSDMYSVLLNGYAKEDVYNWYYYGLNHSGENRERYYSLEAFCSLYKGYKGDLADIAKKTIAEREENRKYWESKEGKAETEKFMKEKTDEFLKQYLGNANTV